MAQVSRSHHTVPRFYLQRFADDRGFANVVRLPGDVRYSQSVAKVSVVNDFYSVGSGPERDAIEKLIADEIERPAAAVFRKVLDDGIWPLNIEDRSTMTTYLALQFGRGTNRRKSIAEFAEFVTAQGGPHGLPESEVARAQALKQIHIEKMLDFEKIGRYFFGRVWKLVRVDRGLITSDTPISLLPFEDADVDAGLGLSTAESIIFPMSPTTALVMNFHAPASRREAEDVVAGAHDSVIDAPDGAVQAFNSQTISNARHSLFHHPDDAGHVPTDLPMPRTEEIRIAPVVLD